MRGLRRKVLIPLAVAFGLCVATVAYAASATPVELACLFVQWGASAPLPNGPWVEPGSSEADRARFSGLHEQARARIVQTFGASRSRPMVAFLEDTQAFWPLRINEHGSAATLANCVVIGPKGQSVDVVAHELMHRELSERVGLWRELTTIPTWFHEGVAMQVDHRPRYLLQPGQVYETGLDGAVDSLRSVRQFNRGDDEEITQHYRFAKAEVARWLEQVGPAHLYAHLERIRAGESFRDVMGAGAR